MMCNRFIFQNPFIFAIFINTLITNSIADNEQSQKEQSQQQFNLIYTAVLTLVTLIYGLVFGLRISEPLWRGRWWRQPVAIVGIIILTILLTWDVYNSVSGFDNPYTDIHLAVGLYLARLYATFWNICTDGRLRRLRSTGFALMKLRTYRFGTSTRQGHTDRNEHVVRKGGLGRRGEEPYWRGFIRAEANFDHADFLLLVDEFMWYEVEPFLRADNIQHKIPSPIEIDRIITSCFRTTGVYNQNVNLPDPSKLGKDGTYYIYYGGEDRVKRAVSLYIEACEKYSPVNLH